MFSQQHGVNAILKKGNQYLYNEEVINSTINACQEYANRFSTCFGPNGMKKILVNHIDKLFVTSDASTLTQQFEVQHPAAKMLAQAAKMQNQEFCDGTNYIIVFAGSLFNHASASIQKGYHIADIVKGYQLALDKCLEELPKMTAYKLKNIRDKEELTKAVISTLASKALGHENLLASLTSQAIHSILPPNPAHLNLDNVRIAKILGGSISESSVLQGMVITREVSSVCKEKTNCKVMVLGCGLELTATETKGTVLIHTAEQLINYSKGEEEQMESVIRDIVNAGVEAIIVGGNISDLGQHYCNKYDILTLKCQSKFELRRICRTLGAASMIQLKCPTAEECGYAESISVQEIASTNVTMIKTSDSQVATIILRGTTNQMLDELERAIGDGLRCIYNIIKDNNFVCGAGATEIQLSTRLQKYMTSITGLEQASILKFAQALEQIPHIIAENAGLSSARIVTQLYAKHNTGNVNYGVVVQEISTDGIINVLSTDCDYPIIDHLKTKESAIKLTVDTVTTILTVNALFAARPAGGPKPPNKTGHWDDD